MSKGGHHAGLVELDATDQVCAGGGDVENVGEENAGSGVFVSALEADGASTDGGGREVVAEPFDSERRY